MIVNKEDFFKSLDFVERDTRGQRPGEPLKDIYIKIRKGSHGEKDGRFVISMRNGVNELFGDYLKIARYKYRIVFAPASAIDGYKINVHSQNGKTYATYALLSKKAKNFKPFVDVEYNLKYDDLYEYWYIENEELKEEAIDDK